ncbi:hypothetical protein RN001_015566 [Aquatica leii]|uniref:Uncharacterized protein n=1 Tax=Aquatica leii TaxID=1421715 RepID=A0AAN7NZ77_9COLE|nr:hypothetical protein RN001_015566 [Aquatica leii]
MSTGSDCFDLCLEELEDHDEYIANLQEDEEIKREYDIERPNKFQSYFDDYKNDLESIFNLPGMHFIRYTHKKIKFSFRPSLVAEMVSAKLIFIISLKYRMGYWMVKREYVPVNYMWKICKLFYTTTSFTSHFRFTDDNIPIGIEEIWKVLCNWALNEDSFRKEKRKRYRRGEDVYIDEDDEELFLSETEVQDLHKRRSKIWKRMLPPPSDTLQRPRRKRRIQ